MLVLLKMNGMGLWRKRRLMERYGVEMVYDTMLSKIEPFSLKLTGRFQVSEMKSLSTGPLPFLILQIVSPRREDL